MGKFFSDDVELALKCIFYDMRSGTYDGKKGIELLIAADKRDDGDAAYFLSRCYAGRQYVWSKHNFSEDDDEVIRLMRRSVALGSAVGLLGAMRTEGVLTPSVLKYMPFSGIKEVWDIVFKKAQDGEPFCQYMIGNTYFWSDIVEIEGRTPETFTKEADFVEYLKENYVKCIPWFEKAFENGVFFAGNNLRNLYSSGKGQLFVPQPEKDKQLIKRGAELGYPNFQAWYAEELYKDKKYEEALVWYQKAVNGGQTDYLFEIGRAYLKGEGTRKDTARALEYFENGIRTYNSIGSYNFAGQIYFEGRDGIPQDYAKALQYFESARKAENLWSNDMLAYCHLHGYGCRQDYAYVKKLLEEVDWNSDLKRYCLGLIYADGLGVPEDIKKGVEYLQKSELTEAKQALLRFKRTLFGKWVRK